MTELQLPGRLGDPDMTFDADPRADARITAAMKMMELAPGLDIPDIDADDETALAYTAAFENAAALAHPLMWEAMPSFDDVESSSTVIKGVDGNDITLYIDRPKSVSGQLPAMVHTHGGGMVVMTAEDPACVLWRKSVAQLGIVVVGVEFLFFEVVRVKIYRILPMPHLATSFSIVLLKLMMSIFGQSLSIPQP